MKQVYIQMDRIKIFIKKKKVPEKEPSEWEREWTAGVRTRKGHHQAEPQVPPSPHHLSLEFAAPVSLWSLVA